MTLSIDRKIYAKGSSYIYIAYNRASKNGGGIHLSNSEFDLHKDSIFVLLNNTATKGEVSMPCSPLLSHHQQVFHAIVLKESLI